MVVEAESVDLTDARIAYEQRDWTCAREMFSLVEAGALSGEDLENWGYAALWERDLDESILLFERAADAFRDEGEADREAFAVLRNAQLGLMGGNETLVGVALARAERLLDGVPECEAHALRGWGMANQVSAVDVEAATPMLEDALAGARRVGSPTVEALALMSLAHNSIRNGAVRDGLQMIDAAATLALSDDVGQLAVGAVLCSTIFAHRDVGDWKRAGEWADATQRWLDRTRVSIFPGLCRVHRCEVARVRGELSNAEQDATLGCEELAQLNKPMAGYGFHELGEIRLRRGDLHGAEVAFRRAVEFGSDAQPGLGRLRLVRGDAVGALRALEDALAGTGDRAIANRPYVLPVVVSAALEVGDVDRARGAAVQLGELAELYDADAHRAAAEQSQGEVALRVGSLDAARSHLRRAWELWCAVDAPYEAASARVLLADAAIAAQDAETARFEIESARVTFERIGARVAVPDVERRLLGLGRSLDAGERVERTFMFTDIVNSMRLQTAMGDQAWDRLLAWHDRALREVIHANRGEEVKHEGDGFFVVFSAFEDAARCGISIQGLLALQRDEQGFVPEVRIGIHAGPATARAGDYYGRVVSEAARITSAAGPGEVLCTNAELPPGVVRLESRRLDLKGIDQPIEVHVIGSR